MWSGVYPDRLPPAVLPPHPAQKGSSYAIRQQTSVPMAAILKKRLTLRDVLPIIRPQQHDWPIDACHALSR